MSHEIGSKPVDHIMNWYLEDPYIPKNRVVSEKDIIERVRFAQELLEESKECLSKSKYRQMKKEIVKVIIQTEAEINTLCWLLHDCGIKNKK